MTLATALAVNAVFVVALLVALAYVMSLPRKLASTPLSETVTQTRVRRQRHIPTRRALVAVGS